MVTVGQTMVRGSRLSGNVAQLNGGALMVTASVLTIEDSVFADNSAQEVDSSSPIQKTIAEQGAPSPHYIHALNSHFPFLFC